MIHRICGPMMHRPLHGTTDVFVKITEQSQGTKYEIRMGWTFPGQFNCTSCNDPFDYKFHDNCIRVVAYYRLKVAWSLFQKELKSLAEGYWA